jgi:hypothetical protein
MEGILTDLISTLRRATRKLRIGRGKLFVLMIFGALIAFESFNFGTTEFALTDLLGDLQFMGTRWATILAVAFCGMDFAGIARLFTPERDGQEPLEVWYLLGAWFLAATMNAMLTWWAVSLALIGHQGLGNEVVGREALLSGVPIFVAALVWLIRVLIIGTFTLAGERVFNASDLISTPSPRIQRTASPTIKGNGPQGIRPAPKPVPHREPLAADSQVGNGAMRPH